MSVRLWLRVVSLEMSELNRPDPSLLAEYESALRRGWSPNNVRPREAAREQLEKIALDPDGFLNGLEDREAKGPEVVLPDGSLVAWLPSFTRWIWADGFCGSIGFRWQRGTAELPSHVLGHIGYAVVPWRRNEGHATAALGALLKEIEPLQLLWVELTTDPDNVASSKVIEKCGGALIETFEKDMSFGGGTALRWRIKIGAPAP